jgi:large subunit ribosomal protein L13
MNSYVATASTIAQDRKWYVVDAEGKTLGRLASEVAKVLRGKNKPTYTPFLDCGDYVIIVNAEKIAVTGKKLDQKIYRTHSRYVGSMRETTLRDLKAKKPEKVIEYAVKGMLPHGPLGRQMYKKLFVYAGADHKHQAQKPVELTF